MKTLLSVVVGVTLAVCAGEPSAQTMSASRQVAFTIESGTLADALDQWAKQTGFQIVVQSWDLAKSIPAPALKGTFDAQAALDQLLKGTPLTYSWLTDRAVTIREKRSIASALWTLPLHAVAVQSVNLYGQSENSAGDSSRSTDERQRTRQGYVERGPVADSEDPHERSAIPEILVTGTRILNTGIRRSRDDVQPYVILDRKAIERSGATSIEDLLKQRLTMNSTAVVASQSVTSAVVGNTSQIDLRGLGPGQTLILINGHRTASFSFFGTPRQPDLNGIPLAAIERIEVLPATASGIYGGSATGGVINIVLRHDYSGFETRLTYESPFETEAPTQRVDLSTGFSLGGKTEFLIAGSYAHSDPLLVRDRSFLSRGRSTILSNSPANYYNATTPPLGATTNIRSAMVVNGVTQNLTLKGSGTPLNSPITYIPIGYSGVASDSGAALVANAGTYNFASADTAQNGGGGRQGLVNEPTVGSLMAAVRYELTPAIQTYLEAEASNNTSEFLTNAANSTFVIPASSAANPFNEPVRVTTPAFGADTRIESRNYGRRIVAGAAFPLPGAWQGALDYTWSTSRFSFSTPGGINAAAATAGISNGSLNVFRDTSAFPVDFSSFAVQPTLGLPTHTKLRNSAIHVAGALASLPAGDITLSSLVEYRDETIDDQVQVSSTARILNPSRSQTTRSIYLEGRIPLFSPRNARPGLHDLELQVAGRHDQYDTTGSNTIVSVAPTPETRASNEVESTDPTIGVRYQPTKGVTLRASFGTGFLPPNVNQLVTGPSQNLPPPVAASFRDPLRNGQPLGTLNPVLVTSGGNTDLRPEESKSWSAGLILTPSFAEGLRMSLDWISIKKTDNITTLFLNQDSINTLVESAPERITRSPVAGPGFNVGPITAIDLTAINLQRARVSAIDAAIDYRIDALAIGDLLFSLGATRQLDNETQITSSARSLNNVGLISALKWKANAQITWTFRSWSVDWATRYFDAYWLNTAHTAVPAQGSASIPSQLYHDLFVTYTFRGTESALLADTEIRVGVKNLFDEKPPVDAQDIGSSTFYSALGDPRLASYFISIRKAF